MARMKNGLRIGILLFIFTPVFVFAQQNVRDSYLNYCAGCHGEKLEKFNKSDWMYGDSDDAAISSIRDGREDIGMPAFKETFSDQEIRELAVYVRSSLPGEKQLKGAI
ncbi:MAG: cytochrome c [Bacteroidales bacterium]|jgi:mono/diheme cytochrome c family protein|nr:cytochrome c [Bacteroidales bacterium]